MKKLIYIPALILIWLSLFAQSSSAQTVSPSLLDTVKLNFVLNGIPTPQDVGFDNPKSYWKIEYRLVLSDSPTMEKIGRCSRTEDYKLDCILNKDKKLDKQIRKLSIPIARGKFTKRQLQLDANNDVTIPVQLSPEVIAIFNKAAASDANPAFILFVKTKTYMQTSGKTKFKGKFTTSGVHPLKILNPDKSFRDYWNVSQLGVAFGITKSDDGTIRLSSIWRF